MKLLIDIGNTRLKWQLHEDADNYASGALSHESVPHHAQTLWQSLPLDGVWIASVGSNQCRDELTQQLTDYGFKVHAVRPQAHFAGVQNAYTQPHTLGVDRWLGVLAAHHHIQSATMIVSAGTALTIDVVDVNGEHQGGIIAPGLSLMRRSLNEHTAALPLVDDTLTGLGTNTQHAISSGTLTASMALIEHCFATHRAQYTDLTLILCGGNAQCMFEHLSVTTQNHTTVDADWLFKGLHIYAEHSA